MGTGFWEQNNHVLVCILTREQVTTAWALGFKHLQIPGSWSVFSGMPFDHARNEACKRVLEQGWKYLFFLDDDVVCPPDTILRLMQHNLPIVSGVYFRRNEPLYPVMLKNHSAAPGAKQWVTSYPKNSLVEVDFVGAGCLLIRRDVLTTIPYPWFEWMVDRMDVAPYERISEDFAFCGKAQKFGFKIVVDTSITCKHCGLSESKDGVLKPLAL